MKTINLFLITISVFLFTYIFMYLMVNKIVHVYSNLNPFYIAGLMTIPMLIIELVLMRTMYKNNKINTLLIIFALAIFILLFLFARKQPAITDREFLKLMIPHHAAAISMCEMARLKNPEIKNLCQNIIKNQQSEINFMKAELETNLDNIDKK